MINRVACRLIVASLLAVAAAPRAVAEESREAVVASGRLEGRFLAPSLFHIEEFWIRVSAGTEFNRWLSQGVGHHAVILLTTSPDRFADQKNVRILSGTLQHEIAPMPTPATTDVSGRLPRGDSGFVHVFFLKDPATGTLGAATLETADRAVAAEFEQYDGAPVSIVVAIESDAAAPSRR